MRRFAAAAIILIYVWAMPAHARTADAEADSTVRAVASSLYQVIAPNAAEMPAELFAEGLKAGATDSVAVQRARAVLIGESVSKLVERDFGSTLLGISPQAGIDLLCSYIRGGAAPLPQEQAQKILENAYSAAMTPQPHLADPQAEAAFISAGAEQPCAEILEGGVVYIPRTEGNGASPAAGCTVMVSYTGSLSDGTEFDSTGATPVALQFDSLVPGMRTGLARMRPGGKATLLIPASAAYGSEGFPGVIPGGAALSFDIELSEIRQ